jgi:hypothetical protein
MQSKEFKNATRFVEIFKYAYHNRSAKDYDLALKALQDSLLIEDKFYLRFYEDSIKQIPFGYYQYELPKENIVLYNVETNGLIYVDSFYSGQAIIDSVISHNIIGQFNRGIYLYFEYDPEKNKELWNKLFFKIDYLLSIYQEHREEYSLVKQKGQYCKLDQINLEIVKSNIPVRIVIYFRHPFPPPPPMDSHEYLEPVVVDTIR